MRASRALAVLVTLLVVAACAPGESPIQAILPQAGPEIIIPPGVASRQTADQVAQKMLAEIAANERTLGRALAPARIIRIQLLRPGETYWMTKLDGTNPGQSGMSPDGGPGWMVEAMGTFIFSRPGRRESRGMHGFHLWDDAGGEGYGFFPCWSGQPMAPADMEGRCP